MKHTANLARKETHVLHIPVDQQKNKQDFYNNDAWQAIKLHIA